MGHLNDETYILAIGFGVMIFNIIYWAFGFLRMGMTGMTAQEVGKGNYDEAYRLLFRGLIIAMIGAVLIFLLKDGILKLSLYMIGSNSEVNEQITAYFNARIYAAPATIGLYAFIGWFFGKQNATIPMVITIMVNLLNVVCSYYLVVEMHYEAEGVAYGTVMAQYTGFLLGGLFFLLFYRKQLNPNTFKGILDMAALKNFLLVNIDIFIRTLCLIFAISFFKVMSVKESELIGAANILLLEFVTIAAYGIDGFAYAAESISGKYFGAKDNTSFRKAVQYCFYWGLGLGALYGVVYWVFGKDILNLLTNQQEVIELAMSYLVWLILFPVLSVVAFVWDGIYIGLTASKAMRNTMLLATFIVFIPSYYLFSYLWGNHGLWLAMILFVSARGISQTILAKRVVYEKLRG